MDIKVTRNHWHECRIGGAQICQRKFIGKIGESDNDE